MSGSRTRKYSAEEKEQLLANLDLEVAHKTRQFEEWLADALENFRRHQEGLILRIPRIVRNVTLREFAKYNGDIQECVKGLKRELLGAEDNTIDPSTRKRKWIESQEIDNDKLGTAESSRALKTGMVQLGGGTAFIETICSPHYCCHSKEETNIICSADHCLEDTIARDEDSRKGLKSSYERRPLTHSAQSQARPLQRVPSGAMSPSPQKGSSRPLQFPRTPSRFASPNKPTHSTHPTRPVSRVPSSSTFNPVLPSESSHPRWPRKDENMLSVNGSPLANPYQLDLKNWFKAVTEGEGGGAGSGGASGDSNNARGLSKLGVPGADKLKKQRSIVVRSTSSSSLASHGGHSRSTSQASTLVASQSGLDKRTSAASSTMAMEGLALPELSSAPSVSALVSVQTKDGHVLEFNPLQTSPEELDALEGITDSAKKQAKEDMARLVQITVQRWKLS
ncbi:hypothetical protein BN946_scf184915.g43 [Trametes cinnabarina]|uniref:Borealin N-terminal domain-containing protein n=1 Tax=Pycnoporus cinnabarinus TaxID=5643 RepID=A0A060SHI8_PYCCI|nr:hypothetical protein BN946_scf184915.g43 [Trametes cinnabarina]